MNKQEQEMYNLIELLEDLIKNHSYTVWDNGNILELGPGERVVHINDIKEKIKELKIRLKI